MLAGRLRELEITKSQDKFENVSDMISHIFCKTESTTLMITPDHLCRLRSRVRGIISCSLYLVFCRRLTSSHWRSGWTRWSNGRGDGGWSKEDQKLMSLKHCFVLQINLILDILGPVWGTTQCNNQQLITSDVRFCNDATSIDRVCCKVSGDEKQMRDLRNRHIQRWAVAAQERGGLFERNIQFWWKHKLNESEATSSLR